MDLVSPEPLAPLAASLRSGALPLGEYLRRALDRADSVEPEILSLLPEPGRRERLLREAAELERRWPEPASRPSLYGILLGVKDLFAADGFQTRAGSRLPPELFAMAEGLVVSSLRKAGALVLGKTVSTEFAYFAPGPTRNPWDPSRTPGGSSSGSAAAVAAGLCPLAVGTQTIGSISRPAAFCGVAGWKPSYERTSREGAVAFSPSLDHVGLFASDAAGLSLAAPVVASGWRSADFDAASSSYARAFEAGKGASLAVPDGPFLAQASQEALYAFEAGLERLEAMGCSVRRINAMADIEEINARHRRIAAAELARVHASWFAAHGPLYSETTAELIRTGRGIAEDELERDLSGRFRLRRELEEALGGADFWISPAAVGPAPEGLSSTGSPIMNLPWTHAGLPTLVLPADLSAEGLPLGLQLAARFGRDEELLAFGRTLEAQTSR